MVRCLVLGAKGVLANCLAIELNNMGLNVFGVSRSPTYDAKHYKKIITSDYTVANLITILELERPDIVINTVAEINLLKCQNDFKSAYDANVRIIDNISRAILHAKHTFYTVHISTDNVYSKEGLSDESEARCVNNYAFSKLMGEIVIQNIPVLILRTNFLVATAKGTTYFDWVLNTIHSPKKIKLYSDIKFNPTSAQNMAKNIMLGYQSSIYGTFNLGCNSVFTKAAFHLLISSAYKPLFKYDLVKCPQADCPRPLDMSMSNEAAISAGFKILEQDELIDNLLGVEKYEF